MKWNNRLKKFLVKHSFAPLVLFIFSIMAFPIPPFLGYQYKGIVDKVYDGYIYGRYSRGTGQYFKCIYIQLENSNTLFNTTISNEIKRIKNSNIQGKKVLLVINHYKNNDNRINELYIEQEGYLIRYDWLGAIFLVLVMVISAVWIVIAYLLLPVEPRL